MLKYDAVMAGEVQNPGLGPLHTEFDGKGYAYTSMFLSSEIVKWSLKDFTVVDRIPTYYSIGHLMIPGGDSQEAVGQVRHRAQQDHQGPLPADRPRARPSRRSSIDINGDKMKLLLDFPDHRRAALRAGAPGLADQGQAGQDVSTLDGEQGPLRDARAGEGREGGAEGQRGPRLHDRRSAATSCRTTSKASRWVTRSTST